MKMTDSRQLDQRIRRFIDDTFRDVEPSQQLFDLKEELAGNLREKTLDLCRRGLDEEQAFREAIVSMGSLSTLVEEMHRLSRREVHPGCSTIEARVSNSGLVLGVLLVLFGLFTLTMTYYMKMEPTAVVGNGIFVVIGGTVITYCVLARETRTKHSMNRPRASMHAVAVGLLLFSLFSALTSRYATGEMFIAVAAMMVFFLAGTGLLLYLLLTNPDRTKQRR
jgi:cation transport ATPase